MRRHALALSLLPLAACTPPTRPEPSADLFEEPPPEELATLRAPGSALPSSWYLADPERKR